MRLKITAKALIHNKIGGRVCHLFLMADINFSRFLRLVFLTYIDTFNPTPIFHTTTPPDPSKLKIFVLSHFFAPALTTAHQTHKKSLRSHKNSQIRVFLIIICTHKTQQPILARISQKILAPQKLPKITSQNFSRPHFQIDFPEAK